ncbi:MAG: alpha-glucan family phosphorylase, partial [Spirochaetia bacterium]|nr:alpha-glucan family phosphorylase [Spirochaetia bacterium]
NTPEDRGLTSSLYGGDERYRLAQEILLGIGGVRMLKALGFEGIERYHMNEGHSALLGLELLEHHVERRTTLDAAIQAVRKLCVFTTHTPVPAGHDKFDYGMVRSLLKTAISDETLCGLAGDDNLNMTLLALNLSGYVNGVARKHKEVSRGMFPGYEIQHITNGVHSYTWTADAMRNLFDLLIFAGKAHPRDEGGKDLIQRIIRAAAQAPKGLNIVFMENYEMELARLIVGGVDVWLNTPQRPLEASGTSGMKAAHNGVPSVSILDGWWIEGCISGITGWPIGPMHHATDAADDVDTKDAEDLYNKLEGILEIYYRHPGAWAAVMKQSVAFNASFFNTHRMVQQYVTNAYIT